MGSKKLIQLFSALYLLQIFFSCGTPIAVENSVIDVHFTVLQKGTLFGAGDEGISDGIIAVRSMEEFQAVLSKMNSVNPAVSEDLVSDLHFFDQKMMIFVFDKVRGSGGYTLGVQKILSSNNELEVEVLTVPPNGPATSVMTQPFEIIELNKTDLPVVVRFI